MIATRLVRKRTMLPHQILNVPKAIPIPITASGGTREAAIATHARPDDILWYQSARNATAPEANAIHRSTRVGWVLAAISLVTSVRGMIQVRMIANRTPAPILSIRRVSALRNSFLFPVATAKATHWIGLMIGAISIAHITTGVAFTRSHSVAMTAESHI